VDPSSVDGALIEDVVARARSRGLELSGPNGRLAALTKRARWSPRWRVRSPTTSGMSGTTLSGMARQLP
jgi:hypothetical protein